MARSDIGLVGLGVMGANLARNIASKKFRASVYNRTIIKTDAFIRKFGSTNLTGYAKLKDFVGSLERPRKIILMVKAGKAVDEVVAELVPLLSKGDILIDCGNSLYTDTIRREKSLARKGMFFYGCGLSEGEEGALLGPSLMVGGNKNTWKSFEKIFKSIAAKDFTGKPCAAYLGENGAGHFVKMVHNGIEYAVLQMMAEAYELLSRGYYMSAYEVAAVFKEYNEGRLKSFLLEISVHVLRRKDDPTKNALIDVVLDKAGKKSTDKWTVLEGLERGIVISPITSAGEAQIISNSKEERGRLSKLFKKPMPSFSIDRDSIIGKLENTLYAGIMIAYAQGFRLLRQAAEEQKWKLNFAEIARIWEGGFIIRAEMLRVIHEAFSSSDTSELWENQKIAQSLSAALQDSREVVGEAIKNGIPLFSLGAALTSFEAFTNEKTPTNFIQALRDAFGAHTYERIDQKGTFHTEWVMRRK